MVSFAIWKSSIVAACSLFTLVTAYPGLVERQTIRKIEWNVTWEKGAPDGFSRNHFKINGQFPGPTLELEEGNDVWVHVNNKSPYPITIHFHGIEMLRTPWSDGVPGTTQRHIDPNCAFNYKWKATQHGSYWYHSHSDGQLDDGLYGAIIIHPSLGVLKPFSSVTSDATSLSLIAKAERRRVPLLLGDWRHIDAETGWAISEQAHIELLCVDSILINGKGNVNCLTPEQQTPLITPGMAAILSLKPGATLTDKSCVPPEIYPFLAPPGFTPPDISVIPHNVFFECTSTTNAPLITTIKQPSTDKETWVIFDLIGAFAINTAIASIDEIPAWVIALDGNYIEPVQADAFRVTNGQRYTILAKFTKPKKYTFRVSSVLDTQILFGTSIIDFQVEGQTQSPTPSIPFINQRGQNATANVRFYDGSVAKPFPPSPPSQSVDATYKVTMTIDGAINRWALNTTSRPDTEDDIPPLLFAPIPGLQDNHTITVASESSWVDYILQVPAGLPAHPIHFHGRHFHVIGSGTGNFKWPNVAAAIREQPKSFNLVNPQIRDTFTGPTSADATWLAVRRPSDNEGVWLIHCHIQTHVRGGMSMVIQDGTDGGISVPNEYRNYRCAA